MSAVTSHPYIALFGVQLVYCLAKFANHWIGGQRWYMLGYAVASALCVWGLINSF